MELLSENCRRLLKLLPGNNNLHEGAIERGFFLKHGIAFMKIIFLLDYPQPFNNKNL